MKYYASLQLKGLKICQMLKQKFEKSMGKDGFTYVSTILDFL